MVERKVLRLVDHLVLPLGPTKVESKVERWEEKKDEPKVGTLELSRVDLKALRWEHCSAAE